VIAVFIKPHGETAKAEFSSADRPGRDGAADWRRRPPAIRAADFDKQGQANPAFPLPPRHAGKIRTLQSQMRSGEEARAISEPILRG